MPPSYLDQPDPNAPITPAPPNARQVPYITSQLAERSIASMAKELAALQQDSAQRKIEASYKT